MGNETKQTLRAGKVKHEEMTFVGPYVEIRAGGALMIFDGIVAVVGGLNEAQAEANAAKLVEGWNRLKNNTDEVKDRTIADLLEASIYALENLTPKGNITKDFSGHNAKAVLSKAIHKTNGMLMREAIENKGRK